MLPGNVEMSVITAQGKPLRALRPVYEDIYPLPSKLRKYLDEILEFRASLSMDIDHGARYDEVQEILDTKK